KPSSKQNKKTNTIVVPEDEESEDEPAPYVKPVKDISEEVYELHKSVMVGNIPILNDTDFLQFEEFDFRNFNTMNIRKVDDAAKKGRFEFEGGTCTATISAKWVRVMDSITITVEDHITWKKVEQGIYRYMRANKK